MTRRRGLNIVIRDEEYVRATASRRAEPSQAEAPSGAPQATSPDRSQKGRRQHRLDLRLRVDPDLLRRLEGLAEKAGVPSDVLLQAARRKESERFRAALECKSDLPRRPIERSQASVRLSLFLSDQQTAEARRRLDPLDTGRHHGFLAPLSLLLAEELARLLAIGEALGVERKASEFGQRQV